MAWLLFFYCFWLIYIANFGMLAIAFALLATAHLVVGSLAMAGASLLLAASCTILCMLAASSWRQLPRSR